MYVPWIVHAVVRMNGGCYSDSPESWPDTVFVSAASAAEEPVSAATASRPMMSRFM